MQNLVAIFVAFCSGRWGFKKALLELCEGGSCSTLPGAKSAHVYIIWPAYVVGTKMEPLWANLKLFFFNPPPPELQLSLEKSENVHSIAK